MSFIHSIAKFFKQLPPHILTGRFKPLTVVFLLLMGLVSFNVLGSLLPFQLDITEGRVFTLSKGSRKLLTKLEYPVTLRLYYSQSLDNLPLTLQVHSRRVKGLLRSYQRYSKGKVKVEIIDPKPDTEQEEWALRYGINESRLATGERLFFGLVALQQEREAVAPYLDPRRESSLEYSISEAIVRVTRKSLPSVQLISFLPVGGKDYGADLPALNQPSWAFVNEISKNYQLEILTINDLIAAPKDVDVMILLHPKEEVISERNNYAIDQYVLAGGKLILFLDPLSTKDLSGQPGFNSQPSSDLSVLLDAWGMEYSPVHVIGDVSHGKDVRTQQGTLNYPFWLDLGPGQMNQDHVLTSQLENILLVNSGSFTPKKEFAYRFTPLLITSENSGQLGVPSFSFQSPLAQVRSLQTDGKPRIPAALISGKFKTAYPDGAPEATASEKKFQTELSPHLEKAATENSILLMADTDFIADDYAVQRTKFLGNVFLQPLNDNFTFLLNALELFSGGQDLIAVRSRGKTARPFTRLVDIQVRAAKRFQEQEAQLNVRLSEVRERLRSLQDTQTDDILINSAQQKEIDRFLQEEQKTRRALREVRKLLREDIERLGSWLLAFNLLLVPVLVSGFGFWFIGRRSRRGE